MKKEKVIRFCYRKIIDATSTGQWEAYVFNDSYQEFLMQVQLYNQEKKYSTFAQLLHHVPGAEQLHFLVSSSVVGYIQQLKGIVPDITSALGKTILPFSHFRFEIINSDITDRGKHLIAVNFYTEEVQWLDTIGTQLLISISGKQENNAVLSELINLQQPFLSIYSLSEKAA